MNRLKLKSIVFFILFLIGLALTLYGTFDESQTGLANMSLNLGTEILGGLGLFLFIDYFITKPDDKIKLIRQLENDNQNIVQQAVNELRWRGWLKDGSLYGYFLQNTNFTDVNMGDANLTGLGLYKAKLVGTHLTDEQFCKMKELRGSMLHDEENPTPDGKKYDGRYCLLGDIDWAMKQHHLNFIEATPAQMAEYYGVSTEEFINGQKWAFKNLHRFNREIPPYLTKLSHTWIN